MRLSAGSGSFLMLSSNGIRNDLQHPNEYIRGNTLRFLCKLREAELIEPLLSSARSCLEHRHAYVRKNAVFAVASIYQHSESLIPDAAELIAAFLEAENDHTCKRNAFAALVSISHEKALAYLSNVFDGIPNADELLQLVELEFIRKDAIQNPQNKVFVLPQRQGKPANSVRPDICGSSSTYWKRVLLPLFTKQRRP